MRCKLPRPHLMPAAGALVLVERSQQPAAPLPEAPAGARVGKLLRAADEPLAHAAKKSGARKRRAWADHLDALGHRLPEACEIARLAAARAAKERLQTRPYAFQPGERGPTSRFQPGQRRRPGRLKRPPKRPEGPVRPRERRPAHPMITATVVRHGALLNHVKALARIRDGWRRRPKRLQARCLPSSQQV